MSTMAEAIDRLAKAGEAQVRLLEAEERRREEQELAPNRIVGQMPRRMNALTFCRAVPGFVKQFERKIPPEFWGVDGRVAVVACPCGETPRVEHGGLKGCDGCDRFYLYDGEDVRVTGGPKQPGEA